jgi:hypothetical protein
MKSSLFFSLLLQIFAYSEAPRQIPPELYDAYTLNNRIPVIYAYRDDTYPPTEPLFYSKENIDQQIDRINRRQTNYYGKTDTWLYEALSVHAIKDKEVAIIGSATSWYESIVIAFGGIPTTIEYNKILTNDSRLRILTVEEFNSNPKKFDAILCISSIEHDGLGRYGDPLNPVADLNFMQKIKEDILKPDGKIFLAVPIGRDLVIWNLGRVYGKIRFPLLITGWTVIDYFGFNPEELDGALGNHGYQPVFVLQQKNFLSGNRGL